MNLTGILIKETSKGRGIKLRYWNTTGFQMTEDTASRHKRTMLSCTRKIYCYCPKRKKYYMNFSVHRKWIDLVSRRLGLYISLQSVQQSKELPETSHPNYWDSTTATNKIKSFCIHGASTVKGWQLKKTLCTTHVGSSHPQCKICLFKSKIVFGGGSTRGKWNRKALQLTHKSFLACCLVECTRLFIYGSQIGRKIQCSCKLRKGLI